jgi:uncharacterized repeat protein (TIGR02543 family)
VDATLEAGEDPNVAGVPGGASIWYSWTAPASEVVRIDTSASDFDTLLGVYTGTALNNLVEVASNDDFIGGGVNLWSRVRFKATSGTLYRIRVDGNNGEMGVVGLHLFQTAPPPNDDFANAFVLSGLNAQRLGDTNEGAWQEPGEPPTILGASTGASVWYSWTPPANGSVTIDTATSGFDTLLAVYTGSAVGALSDVASNDDAGPSVRTSLVTFPATSGTVYRIRVDGYQGDAGTINLHLALTTAPGAPTGVAATAGNASATVSWTAPASNGGTAVTGYDVTSYVAGVAQGTTSVGVVTLTTVTGLTNGATYTFRVAAKNAIGTGAQSSDSNAVTPQTVAGAPSGVAATAGNASATVSWTAPASNGGSAITGYDVTPYVGVVPQATTSVGLVTQTTVSGLTNGTTYTFRVAAKNGAGIGAQSADSNAVTPTASAPVRFTLTVAKSGAGSGTVTSSVGAINCGAICSAVFDQGTSVALTATASSGSTFAGWTGACSGTGSCTVTIDAAKTATATFSLNQTPPPPIKCVVPNVKRKTLATAKRKIAAAHCRTGTVTRTRSKTVPKGRVISQKPAPGKRLARGSKVNLVVSRGKR